MSSPVQDSFTCVSCRLLFNDWEVQKLHYKSDWHRYNLKRKVAGLPPVTSAEFTRRVQIQRKAEELSNQPESVYCEVCKKNFSNRNAFNNHLDSKKHKFNEKHFEIKPKNVKQPHVQEDEEPMSIDSEIEEVDSDEWDDVENPIENNDCIFCLKHSRNFISNLEHMTIQHSFFIPDVEYCIDVEGLLKYLGEKICDGFMCIWCNEKGRTFYSADAARKHIVDKGHCKVIYEGAALAEYSDFYDYSSSYPDAEDEDVNPDEEVSLPEMEASEYQLVLPSGVTVGHRSLMRYYKQSVNPNKIVVVPNKNKKLHKVLTSYKALGWTVTDQNAAAKRARDIHYLKRMKSKYMLKIGLKNNNQQHFRQQSNY